MRKIRRALQEEDFVTLRTSKQDTNESMYHAAVQLQYLQRCNLDVTIRVHSSLADASTSPSHSSLMVLYGLLSPTNCGAAQACQPDYTSTQAKDILRSLLAVPCSVARH